MVQNHNDAHVGHGAARRGRRARNNGRAAFRAVPQLKTTASREFAKILQSLYCWILAVGVVVYLFLLYACLEPSGSLLR